MGEIMDIRSAAEGPKRGPVDLFGDTATGKGWVRPSGEEPWQIDASALSPVAGQLFSRAHRSSWLREVHRKPRLGRASVEYAGSVTGQVDGTSYTNVVRRAVSAPYVLLDDVRDAANGDYYRIREVLSVVEGQVKEADVAPPR